MGEKSILTLTSHHINDLGRGKNFLSETLKEITVNRKNVKLSLRTSIHHKLL